MKRKRIATHTIRFSGNLEVPLSTKYKKRLSEMRKEKKLPTAIALRSLLRGMLSNPETNGSEADFFEFGILDPSLWSYLGTIFLIKLLIVISYTDKLRLQAILFLL